MTDRSDHKRKARASVAVKPPTKAQIAQRLRQLATRMEDVGAAMDYYGGRTELAEHGRELVGAAGIARQWAGAIEDEIESE